MTTILATFCCPSSLSFIPFYNFGARGSTVANAFTPRPSDNGFLLSNILDNPCMHRHGVLCTKHLRSHIASSRHDTFSLDFVRARSSTTKKSSSVFQKNGRMVEQMTKAVLSAASRSEANSGWRRSPARRGKELELVNAILEESQMPSKASVFAEAEEADSADSLDVSSTSLLPKQLPLSVGPGSFVQMRRCAT